MLHLAYYVSAAGRAEAAEYIAALPGRVRGQVLADLEAYRMDGAKAPISWKPISGHRPMFEIRIGAQRLYCVVHRQTLWVLQAGPKGRQDRDIEKATARMKLVVAG